MGIIRPTENVIGPFSLSSTLPTGDIGNATVILDGALGATFECTAASSGTGTVEVQHHAGGDWFEWHSYEYVSGTATLRAAGTTITLADNDLLFVPSPGFHAVRFNLGGTSATVYGRTCENLTDLILALSGISIASGSAIIPRPNIREVTLTFSTDTSIYADNDVIADSQILAAVTRANDSKGFLIAFELTDEDDNTAIDMDIIFLSANVSVGTENAAVSISDANARNIIGVINILAADWNDHINSKMVSVGNKPGSMLSMPITPVSGSDDIYVALVCRSGTPTYTASGITARFWFIDGN